MSKSTFKRSEHADDNLGYTVHARLENERGYVLSAISMRQYETLLEFVQVDFPDGTSAYFSLFEGEAVAGPFGGGYSWACPKYVHKAAEDLLLETFSREEEEVPV